VVASKTDQQEARERRQAMGGRTHRACHILRLERTRPLAAMEPTDRKRPWTTDARYFCPVPWRWGGQI